MANAIFLNATPFAIGVNLNVSEANQPIGAMRDPTQADPPKLTLPGAAFPIAANKRDNVFGASTPGNDVDNLLIIFSPDRGVPGLWHLQSTVSVALGLYFYLLDDLVVGVDQTGGSAGITIRQGSIQEFLQLIELFSGVPWEFPTLS
jgi:hypothetical protein